MKYYVLYNPLAGHGSAESDIAILSEKLNGEIIKCDVTKIENYKSFIADKTEDDTIVICGGDGTINRFVNGTDGLDSPGDVMYFPAGTGNDFLTDLGIKREDCPISIKKYLQNLPTVAVQGKTYKFINNMGFGIDGYCCEMGDKQKAKSTKPVNYTAIAIKGLLFNFKSAKATVIVDGVEHKFKNVWIAPTMKGRYYGGGMIAAPQQDRLDPEGKVSVMVFHGRSRLMTLIAFPSIFEGKHVEKKNRVSIFTGKNVTVKFDGPRPAQVDGETLLGVTEYTVTAGVPAKIATK